MCLRWEGCQENLERQRHTDTNMCSQCFTKFTIILLFLLLSFSFFIFFFLNFKHLYLYIDINACMCMFLCVSITSGCSGSELRVKMESVFRSSNCRFEWRPHFPPVQLLQKTTTISALISNCWFNHKMKHDLMLIVSEKCYVN